MDPASTAVRQRGYGHWAQPKTPGIGTLQRGSSLVLGGGGIVAALSQLVGGLGASLTVVVLTIATVVIWNIKDRHGRTLVDRMKARTSFSRARRQMTNLYRAGVLGFTPHGKTQLPGLAAQLELSEWHDGWGRPFGLIRVPSSDHYTVVFRGEPDGGALVDQEQIDQWVALWGQWLAALGNEPGIVATSVTIETAPDSGARLRNEAEATRDPGAPELAVRAMEQIVAEYPRGSATVNALIAVTFAAARSENRRRADVEEVARDIAARVAPLSQGLATTGAGVTVPMSARELTEFVRIAFDPEAADAVAGGRTDEPSTAIAWDEAGPVSAEAGWDYYRHDSGISRTWQMSRAPRGIVHDTILQRLLEPHPLITRKRVTLLFRPYDSGMSAEIVERDRMNAQARVNSAARPTVAAQLESAAATASAEAEARGAGLVNFAVLVTATVRSADELVDASKAVNTLGTASRMFLRPMYGSQDAGFVASLPLGLVLPEYQRLQPSRGVGR